VLIQARKIAKSDQIKRRIDMQIGAAHFPLSLVIYTLHRRILVIYNVIIAPTAQIKTNTAHFLSA